MIHLNASRGLGDAIYLRAIALHFLRTQADPDIFVYTKWPDVFGDIDVQVRPIDDRLDYLADLRHATGQHRFPADTNDFTLRCLTAGLDKACPLVMDWEPRRARLLQKIQADADGREILVFQPRKIPLNPSMETLRPNRREFNEAINKLSGYYKVKIGSPQYVENDDDIEVDCDLFGKTDIIDVLDICSIAHVFYCELCFLVCAAQALETKCMCMFSVRALNSTGWLRNITPERIFHKPRLAEVLRDE